MSCQWLTRWQAYTTNGILYCWNMKRKWWPIFLSSICHNTSLKLLFREIEWANLSIRETLFSVLFCLSHSLRLLSLRTVWFYFISQTNGKLQRILVFQFACIRLQNVWLDAFAFNFNCFGCYCEHNRFYWISVCVIRVFIWNMKKFTFVRSIPKKETVKQWAITWLHVIKTIS